VGTESAAASSSRVPVTDESDMTVGLLTIQSLYQAKLVGHCFPDLVEAGLTDRLDPRQCHVSGRGIRRLDGVIHAPLDTSVRIVPQAGWYTTDLQRGSRVADIVVRPPSPANPQEHRTGEHEHPSH
jgi:hypothetical protein